MLPKVSVIVPCYNVEKYVRDCARSLLNNDYPNKELVFVNDGSTDGTMSVLNELASNRSSFIVIDKPNGGVSSARNAGLDAATGKYIMFVDPDDYVQSGFMSIPVHEMERCGCDALIFGFYSNWTGRMEAFHTVSEYDFQSNAAILDTLFPRVFGITADNFRNYLRGGVF